MSRIPPGPKALIGPIQVPETVETGCPKPSAQGLERLRITLDTYGDLCLSVRKQTGVHSMSGGLSNYAQVVYLMREGMVLVVSPSFHFWCANTFIGEFAHVPPSSHLVI